MGSWHLSNASVTSNHGLVRFEHPYDFLPARPSEALVWILRRYFSCGHTSGYGSRTAWHGCTLMVWSAYSQDSTWTPCDARTDVARALHGNLQCFSYPMGPVWGPYRTRKDAVRHSYGHGKEIVMTKICKIHAQASYGTVRCRMGPYGPRKGCSRADYELLTRTGAVSLQCIH